MQKMEMRGVTHPIKVRETSGLSLLLALPRRSQLPDPAQKQISPPSSPTPVISTHDPWLMKGIPNKLVSTPWWIPTTSSVHFSSYQLVPTDEQSKGEQFTETKKVAPFGKASAMTGKILAGCLKAVKNPLKAASPTQNTMTWINVVPQRKKKLSVWQAGRRKSTKNGDELTMLKTSHL